MAPTTNPYYSDGSKFQADLTTGFAKIQSDSNVNAMRYQLQAQNDAAKNNLTDQTNRYGIQQRTNTDIFGIVTKDQTQQQKNEYDYQAQLFNYGLQSANRNYATDVNAKTAQQKNQLQSGDNRYQTDSTAQTNRYGINVKAQTDKYQWDNVNKTDLAKAQVQAGTYGVDQNALNSRAADTYYNNKMQNYAAAQNAAQQFTTASGNAERAYGDQRNDLSNQESAASARYNQDVAIKQVQYAEQVAQRQADRDWSKQQFALTSAQWDKDYALKLQTSLNDFAIKKQVADTQTAQVNSNIGLDNSRFDASRADLAYNRNYQSRSFAF